MNAVIFDMDGVIINSEPIHFMIDNQLLKQLAIHHSDDYLDKFVGYTNPAMWQCIKTEFGIKESVDELIARQMSMKQTYFRDHPLMPIDGIVGLLDTLVKMKLKIGVASSSLRLFIEQVLTSTHLTQYIDEIVSGEEVPQSKPEPDVFIQCADALHVAPEHCVVIEDSTHGVIAAKHAGMFCVGFRNLDSGYQDLSFADRIVDHISEVLAVVPME